MENIKNIKCQICGKELENNPENKEYERECSHCGIIWWVKPQTNWDYAIKYNKDKIKIKES